MSFFTVDDQMHSHDKTLELCETATGRQALGLWVVAGSWCGGHPETQGEVSLKRVRALGFTKAHAGRLVDVRLWDVSGDGWAFHNWHDRRPKDAKLAERREKTRVRVANHRARNADGNAVTEKPSNTLPGPIRTVPDLTDPSRNAPGDSLDLFAKAWREITGRSEFGDGCGQYTSTESTWLRNVRKMCGGKVSEFRARVSARLADDTNGFLLKQSLLHWERGPLQAPAKPPAAAAPAAPYHKPMKPRAAIESTTCPDNLKPRRGGA